MEISAERLDEPKKKFWLVLSQLISKAAAAATACIAWGEGTILATYWWIFQAQKKSSQEREKKKSRERPDHKTCKIL